MLHNRLVFKEQKHTTTRAALLRLHCAAMQGFLPTEVDAFVQDVLYPSFSPQMLLFLGMSSAYGLWKTGK